VRYAAAGAIRGGAGLRRLTFRFIPNECALPAAGRFSRHGLAVVARRVWL
jgi:hypothetical protein